MGIDVRWIDESGEVKQEVPDAHDPAGGQGVLSTFMVRSDWPGLPNTVCLRFVDPYGDAVFNRYQLPILIEELRAALRDERDRITREHLERLIALAVQATGEIHTYVKFIGD